MDAIEAIRTRRSVREFTNASLSDMVIEQVLEAGRWAPSGLNNQAWQFIVVKSPGTKEALSKLTEYGLIIKTAPALIVVFLDKDNMYNYIKDVQSIGACIQNILLAIHSLGLGGVWLGEILKNKEKVNKVLGAPESHELMAVIALGYPVEKNRVSERKALSRLVYREKFGQSW